MENKYYTPEIEDLRIGYQCIETVSFGQEWIPSCMGTAEFIGTIGAKAHWENKGSLEGLVLTKYLDKEDIESLGFEFFDEARLEGKGNYLRFKKEWSDCPPNGQCFDHFYGNYYICLNGYPQWDYRVSKILIYKETFGGFVGLGRPDEIIFDGNCPSINELKLLMKLLNIK